MGRRLPSWGDVGGSSGGAEFVKKWQEEGFYKVVLHREPPWERRVHSFRRVEIDEGGKEGPKKRILWYPYVCWEDDNYHRLRNLWKKGREPNEPHAKACPSCLLIEHLEARHDLESDAPIFKFVAGREVRIILKDDFLNLTDSRQAFKDSFVPRTEFLIPHIPVDDPSGVKITAEKWSIGTALRKRIKDDIKIYGSEEGDPSRTPIGYVFSYDKDSQSYGVSRLDKYDAPSQVVELWEGDCPDASRFVAPSNPRILYEQMKGAAELAGCDLPLVDIFAESVRQWKDDEDDDPALVFPPPDADVPKPTDEEAADVAAETPEEAAARKRSEAAKKAAATRAAKKAAAKGNGAAEPAAEPGPAKKQRKTMQTKKKDPPPPKDVEIFECPGCGADWPENLSKCPNPECDEVVDDDEAGDQPAAPGASGDGLPF